MNFTNGFNPTQIANYFYRLVEKSQDIFWIRDAGAKTVLYVSPAFEKIFAIPDSLKTKSMAENWLSQVHPEDRIEFEQNLGMVCQLSQGQVSRVHEYRIMRHDGAVRRLQETMFCLYDAEDEFFGFTGITKDVTHEKEGFGDIEKAMHYFRYFAEKTNAVFWARNQSFDKQIYISPAYEKIWGRHRDEIYLDPSAWFDTVHPDDREEFINNDRFHEMERQGFDARFVRRYRIVLPNGEVKWIKDISFPIQNERNVFIGFAGVAEDVTKEVLHERELCEAKDRAEVANNAKSDFLAMISHEIRTPLNAILGMADILQTKGLAPDVQESVDIIASAGNDLLALVGDILDFARLEAGKLTFNQQPFDIADLFTHILQGMKYLTHGKNVALSLTVEPHMPTTVIGDQKRVRQVLVNLIRVC
jgi:PAS domain S-box-containing protein